jgi:serine/threonine protein kinase
MPKVGENINGYSVDELIHAGGFCNAYKVSRGGVKYFLKEYSDPTKLSTDYYAFFKNQELMIPRLKALGAKTETIIDHFELDRYYQLKEWIQGQDLESWMESNTNYEDRKDLAIQICDILQSIHKQKIIHQDLKPKQFMVIADTAFKGGSRVILTDFDWSIPDGIIVRRVGTPWYKCIDKSVTERSDIFTFGIILCELLTGSNPYQHNGICEDDLWLDWVQNHRYEEPAIINTIDIKPALNKLMVACLDVNPMNRPTLDEIKSALEGRSDAAKLLVLKAGGQQLMIPLTKTANRRSFKAMFSTVTDPWGNQAYQYLDRDIDIFQFVTLGKGVAIALSNNLANKLLLNGTELSKTPTPVNNGDKLEIFSINRGVPVAEFLVELR